MPKYYSLEAKENGPAELYIFGDITSWPWLEGDVSAISIVKELQSLEADAINVHINSYGGEVAEGLAIYNTLKNSEMKVTTICDGFACSAASVIFMAGEERVINESSLLMIHNAWTYAKGNAEELRKQAEDLEKITQASVNAYVNRAKISEEEIKKLMDEETWITAEEAVEYGLATRTEKEEDPGVSQSAFQSIRKRVLATPAEQQMTEKSVERVADLLVQKLIPLFKEDTKKKSRKEDSTGWGAFFNGGE